MPARGKHIRIFAVIRRTAYLGEANLFISSRRTVGIFVKIAPSEAGVVEHSHGIGVFFKDRIQIGQRRCVDVPLNTVTADNIDVSPIAARHVPRHLIAPERRKSARVVKFVGFALYQRGAFFSVNYMVRMVGRRKEINMTDVARIAVCVAESSRAVGFRGVRMHLSVISTKVAHIRYGEADIFGGMITEHIAKHETQLVRTDSYRHRRLVHHAVVAPHSPGGDVPAVDKKAAFGELHTRNVVKRGSDRCARGYIVSIFFGGAHRSHARSSIVVNGCRKPGKTYRPRSVKGVQRIGEHRHALNILCGNARVIQPVIPAVSGDTLFAAVWHIKRRPCRGDIALGLDSRDRKGDIAVPVADIDRPRGRDRKNDRQRRGCIYRRLSVSKPTGSRVGGV
ncbi:unknown [Anaerotruncus sp. CAG:390]|nr:unknown [Anaerotruncus sp. CAG:390]